MDRALIRDAYDVLFEGPGEPSELKFALMAADLPNKDPVRDSLTSSGGTSHGTESAVAQ